MKYLPLVFMLATMSLLAACTTAPPPASTASSGITVVGSGVFASASGARVRADYRSGRTVLLTFADGTSKLLPQAVSGSGARYATDDTEWWEHQGEATYTVRGKQVFSGKIVP